jgi:hypothetical protein
VHGVADGGTGHPTELALLRAYEPVICYTEGELFLPTAVGRYVERCSLWIHEPGTPPEKAEQLVEPGGLTLDRLAATGRDRPDRSLELRFVQQPLRGAAMRAWRRMDRPRLRGTARLAAVGVFARVIDSLLRLSLVLRGRTPGGTAAAAEVAAREYLDPGRCSYHGRVLRDGGYVVLQYWLFHVFNDWRSTFSGINDHEADWELVAVYLADEGGTPVPRWVAASSHDHTGDELRRRWDDPRLRREGNHPVIFAGAGSHAGAFEPGDVLVSVELPLLRRVVEGAARVVRRLVPLARWTPPAGAFGLPFLDYARGNGTAVGPGRERPWDAYVITDAIPWVHDYRGLWGLDTHDVFGGERAPAGPRYERGGAVRASWADPLGWAGLRKEPPGNAAAAADLRAQVQALTARLRELEEEVAAGHAALRGAAAEQRSLAAGPTGLRASVAAKGVAVRKAERALAGLCAEHARLSDELAVHREHLARPVDAGAVDERLRPASTSPSEPGRPRLLRLWGAVSTPLLLLTVVLLLVGPPLAFLSSLTLAVVTFLGVEAAARGRLLSFVVGLGMAVLIAAVGVVLVLALLQNWRVVLAALLSVVALVLLAGNVRELRR